MSLVFPPLMHGYELDKPGHDPFEVAISKAIQGVEAGLVVYNPVSYTHLTLPTKQMV